MANDDGQSQVSRNTGEDETTAAQEVDESAADVAERKAKLDEDIDAILDEIDDVLEENAEEMVRGFVQKGGQ
jgi:ubiquitin-like protein Pup